VFTTNSLKLSLQCQKAAAKARSVLGMVRRNFRKLNANGFLLVYKSYIRPHLEYCMQAWSPYHQKDIQCLESVQRAATKLAPSLRKLSYEDRLNRLGLTTLYQRRIRGDLIEIYKILTRKVNVASDNFFCLHTNSHNTRLRSQLKIVSAAFSTRCSKELFQSESRENLEQFAIRCCQLYICHDVQEKTGQVPYGLDMSVKGAAYQVHYHQSQIVWLRDNCSLCKGLNTACF